MSCQCGAPLSPQGNKDLNYTPLDKAFQKSVLSNKKKKELTNFEKLLIIVIVFVCCSIYKGK
tara:strand:+ start:1638 stop:1823 length:186 start_codon:yes stop_codon:yes gene_type:complete